MLVIVELKVIENSFQSLSTEKQNKSSSSGKRAQMKIRGTTNLCC